MIYITTDLPQYVHAEEDAVKWPKNNSLLLGGDHLTVTRARGFQIKV